LNANNSLTINEVKTLDELFACREACLAIRKSVSKVVAALASNQSEIRQELYAEVSAALVKHLGGTQIKNKKFLKSSNRLGWLSIFARNISRHWIADRVRQSLGDKRVQDALQKQYLPAETFEKYQERAREFAESLAFDLHQFAGKRRPRTPDEFEDAQAAYERTEDVTDPESDEPGPDEQSQTDTLEDERLRVLRDAVSRLPKRDQKFVNSYFEPGHSHASAEWKRFSRLTLRLRHLCQVSPKIGI
jgi:hypothetical protein